MGLSVIDDNETYRSLPCTFYCRLENLSNLDTVDHNELKYAQNSG